ncbi:unnamed protein product, partial [Phaeothamnion confervicola]
AAVTGNTGRAFFSNLFINEAGSGYVLRFVLYSATGSGIAWVDSAPFAVSVGAPHRIALRLSAGTITGGGTFDAAPIVAVQDRGGNDVVSFTGGTVTAALVEAPQDGRLEPAENVTVRVVSGYAAFAGLQIRRAGGDYRLAFRTALPLAGDRYVESKPFTVGVGPAARLEWADGSPDPVGSGKVAAGSPLRNQPRVAVLDAGGNLLADDSTSAVRIGFGKNPPRARLGPEEAIFTILDNGVATFSRVAIDSPGRGLTLRFYFLSYDRYDDTWRETGLVWETRTFDVVPGRPVALSVTRPIDGGWAGGRAFRREPWVALVDAGGSAASAVDSGAVVVAALTASFSVANDVIIDTTGDPAVTTVAVWTPLAAGTYGVGQVVPLLVIFSAPIVLDCTGSGDGGSNSSSGGSRVPALDAGSGTSGKNATGYLVFLYTIEDGDSTAAAPLDYSNIDALHLGDAALVDLLGRAVNTTLPAPGGYGDFLAGDFGLGTNVTIDTTVPTITAVWTTLMSGQYGVGQTLPFHVNFSTPVFVATAEGAPPPLLPLWLGGGNGSSVNAVYVSGSGTAELLFEYVVAEGDDGDDGSGGAAAVTVPAGELLLPISTVPTQAANLTLTAAAVAGLGADISAETTAPAVASVTTLSANGTYGAGDVVFIAVNFTRPVVAFGDIGLRLETGHIDARADYISRGGGGGDAGYGGGYGYSNGSHDFGAAATMLVFAYEVAPGDNSDALDCWGTDALSTGDHGWIRRGATTPTQDADLSLAAAAAAGLGLAASTGSGNGTIIIDGAPPRVIAVALVTDLSADNTTYGLDDDVYIDVMFDKRVVIILTADADDGDGGTAAAAADAAASVAVTPVLVLDVGAFREAEYYGGNDTAVLTFRYTVKMGDRTDNLGYRYLPNALCASSGCPAVTTGKIQERTPQGNIGQPADLRLGNMRGRRASGVPVAANVSVNTAGGGGGARLTYVTGAAFAGGVVPNATYGAGHDVTIRITFSDDLLLAAGSPVLRLNNGGVARLTEGDGTDTWKFVYSVGANDTAVAALDIDEGYYSFDGYGSALNCSSWPRRRCAFQNRDGVAPDLNTTGLNLSVWGIAINTAPPAVAEVFTTHNTSGYANGAYDAGEILRIVVRFDAPVTVLGTPRLLLETGRYAAATNADGYRGGYYGNTGSSGPEDVFFDYIVAVGDVATNLTWGGVDALRAADAGDGTQDFILRRSTRLTTPANLTLPPPAPLARNGQTVALNATAAPPRVISDNDYGDGVYAPGDVVSVFVNFDREVSVVGIPVLHLDVGRNDSGRAEYCGGGGTASLQFEYAVQEGDTAGALDISDRHALEWGYHEAGGAVRGLEDKLRRLIAAAATVPTLPAERVLPFYPGEPGSLSANAAIALDGAVPYITGLDFPEIMAAAAAEYGNATRYAGGDFVLLRVNFSAPVVVVTAGNGSSEGPSLLLETGVIDREAVWVGGDSGRSSSRRSSGSSSSVGGGDGGNGTTSLFFTYTVTTGDASADLDYWCDEADWRWAGASFRLNGAAVLRASASPSLSADVHLNPPGGALTGTTVVAGGGGVATFRDLFVRQYGRGYRMRFAAQPLSLFGILSGDFNSSRSASFSAEYEVTAVDGEAGDAFGAAVALDSRLMVVGAPAKHLDQPEIQIVRTVGSYGGVTTGADGADVFADDDPALLSEVQMIAVEVVHVNEIQKFATYAAAGAAVGGSFRLSYPGEGSTLPVAAAATSEVVQERIETDLSALGRVLVRRVENGGCGGCTGAYVWTVTFSERRGEIYALRTDGAELTGTGANVTSVSTLQDSPTVGGTFRLGYAGWDQKLAPIAYDANGTILAAAIEASLNLTVEAVDLDCCTTSGGRKWVVTFGADRGDRNVSALMCDGRGLTGGGANAWQLTGRDGRGPLLGEFRL